MKGTKNAFASLGIMGPAIGLIVFILNNFVFKSTVVSENDLTQLINQLDVVWTAATAIIGRWRATKTIRGKA